MLEEPPDGCRIYVPLREAACGVALRLFRDRGGERCAVGFTGLDRMVELLGRDQPYYRLTARSVRELAAQRGVTLLLVDPALVAAPVRALEPPAAMPMPVTAPALATALPADAPAARAHHRPLTAVRHVLEHSQTAGILVVSAGAGAAALVLEALK